MTMKILVLIVFLFLVKMNNVVACDCNGERSSAKKLLKMSKEVFIGTFISFKKSDRTFPAIPRMTFYELEFKVDQMLLGDSIKKVIIFGNNSNCTPRFEINKTYLVYSYFHKGIEGLIVNQCFSPCLEINDDDAKADLIKIRKLMKGKTL
jgi:hypothetical protein